MIVPDILMWHKVDLQFIEFSFPKLHISTLLIRFRKISMKYKNELNSRVLCKIRWSHCNLNNYEMILEYWAFFPS